MNKRYGLWYAAGLILIIGGKYIASRVGSDALGWILAPTAWWVQRLSGIAFEKVPRIGYINEQYRFIIAPSCAGIQFMLITIATLYFAFLSRFQTGLGKLSWMGISFSGAYVLTVLINGLRIILSLYLPPYLCKPDGGWITSDRLHTIIGSAVYFISLLVIYRVVNHIFNHAANKTGRNRYWKPVIAYFSITLGIPLLNRTFGNTNDGALFLEYAAVLITVCIIILTVSFFSRKFAETVRSYLCKTRLSRLFHPDLDRLP